MRGDRTKGCMPTIVIFFQLNIFPKHFIYIPELHLKSDVIAIHCFFVTLWIRSVLVLASPNQIHYYIPLYDINVTIVSSSQ